MSLLTRKQIEDRLEQGQLLRNPRIGADGHFDIEADSYDLAAGTAIWKQPIGNGSKANVRTRTYLEGLSGGEQRTITVQPGQMIFIVTHEDIIMPPGLTGTVYSRNNLALKGILALNAGHVDSGYEGPIAIRLINLRAVSWTLTLGEPIFTITFQTVDANQDEWSNKNRRISQEEMISRVRETANAALSNALYHAVSWTLTLGEPIFTITFQTVDANQDEWSNKNRRISQEEMISRVRETANAALSNALYDLYRIDVDKQLSDFKTALLKEFREERDERWVRREDIWSVLLNSVWSRVLAASIIVATLAGGIAAIIYVTRLIMESLPK